MQLGAWRLRRCISRRAPKSSRFSSRASRQITGVLHVTVWYRSTPVEAVGFELSRLVRKHEKEGNSPKQLIDRSTGIPIQAYLRLFGIEARGIEC
jgi:hypothetical protein